MLGYSDSSVQEKVKVSWENHLHCKRSNILLKDNFRPNLTEIPQLLSSLLSSIASLHLTVFVHLNVTYPALGFIFVWAPMTYTT